MKKLLIFAVGLAMVSGSTLRADVIGSGPGASIPDNNPAGFSSTISIGQNETITGDVVVTIDGLTHTWMGDLNVTLTSPSATITSIMSRVGGLNPGDVGDSTNMNGTYAFSDSGPGDLWQVASSLGGIDNVPSGGYWATGPGSGAMISLNALFAGELTAGAWILNISDNAAADTGSFSGWSLSIQSSPVPEPSSLLTALLGCGLLVRRRK